MSNNKLRRLAEDKLIILYLVEKMGIALSNSEICQFLLEKNYINYFNAQQYLSELVESGFLDQQKENNTTRYSLTDEGTEVLSIFIKHISPAAKNDIISYVHENGKRIKAEYEVTANYFLELNNEYSVKCGIYDSEGVCLMEINVSVPSKEQARLMCSNWKKNVNKLYGSIFTAMISNKEIPIKKITLPETIDFDKALKK